jgi:hypothetical protein
MTKENNRKNRSKRSSKHKLRNMREKERDVRGSGRWHRRWQRACRILFHSWQEQPSRSPRISWKATRPNHKHEVIAVRLRETWESCRVEEKERRSSPCWVRAVCVTVKAKSELRKMQKWQGVRVFSFYILSFVEYFGPSHLGFGFGLMDWFRAGKSYWVLWGSADSDRTYY